MRSGYAEAGRENYKSYIYLNLFKNPEYRQVFEREFEPTEIYKRMSLLIKNVKFIEGDTLIFIDEIQACSKARTALKFLAMDDKYDIVASGSLLGLHYNKLNQEKADEISIPVGYEREVETKTTSSIMQPTPRGPRSAPAIIRFLVS
jgi:hypothetical protein